MKAVGAKAMSGRSRKLGTLLSLVFLAIFLPLLLLASYTELSRLETRRASLAGDFDGLAAILSGTVDGFARDLESFALAASVSLGANDRPTDQARTGPFLRQLLASYEILQTVFVTDLSGVVIAADADSGVGIDRSDRPYVSGLMAGRESYWSDAFVGTTSGMVTVTFSRFIRGPDNERQGIFVVAFQPSQLLSRLPADLQEGTNVFLIDSKGFLLHSTAQPEFPLDARDLSGWRAFQLAQAGPTQFRGQPTPLYPDEKRFGALREVPRLGWVIGVAQSNALVWDPLEAAFRRALSIEIGLLLVGLLLTLLVASHLARPLSRLARAAAAISHGNKLALPIESGYAEVEALSTAMSAMATAMEVRAENLRFLSQGSRLLAESLGYEETLSSLAKILVPGLGDWCVVHVLEDGELEQVAIAHQDPERVSWVQDLQRRYPPDRDAPLGPFHVVRTGASEVMEHIPEEVLIASARDEEHLATLRSVGLSSYVCVPLRSRDAVVGAITLVTAESGRRYGEAELAVAEELGRRAGLAIGAARLYRDSQFARQELARLNDALRQANRAKDDFLSLVSHELKSPLTTIIGGSRLLSNRVRPVAPEAAASLAGDMYDEAVRLNRVIDGLLVLARFDKGAQVEMEPLPVRPFVADVVHQAAHASSQRIVMAATDEATIVLADGTYLDLVIRNLVSNAQKYSPQDSVITVSVKQREADVLVTVSDQGNGVPREETAKVFEPFYRSDGSSLAPGLGIGLAVSHKLVEAMGGTIWVEPNEPKGARFCFTLQNADGNGASGTRA